MQLLINYCIISLLLLGTITSVRSQNAVEKTNSIDIQRLNEILDSIKICRWKGGAKTSVNLSFDDNNFSSKQISLILDQYGFKGSFFVNSSCLLIDSLKDILLRDHEIGNHSYTHSDLTQLDSLNVENEITKGKEGIEKALGNSCSSFAAPFNLDTPYIRKIAFEHHLFNRNVSEYSNTKRILLTLGSDIDSNIINSNLNASIKSGSMLLLAGHGIDGNGWNPISSDFLKQILHILKIQSSKGVIWVSPLKEVAQYENLVHEVQLDKQVIGDTLIIEVKGYLYEKYKDLDQSPISMEIPKSGSDSIRYIGKDLILTQKILSDIITIDLKKTNIIKALCFNKFISESINIADQDLFIFPNPASYYVDIFSKIPILKAEVYNLYGELMLIKSGNIQELDTSELKSGIYVIKISTYNSFFTKKIRIIKLM